MNAIDVDKEKQSKIICPCSGTTRAQIEKLAVEGHDMNSIANKTGAVTGCGGCEAIIQELLDHNSAT